MGISIKGNGKTIRRMVKAPIFLKTVTDIKAIGKMIACMVLAIIIQRMAICSRDNGIKTNKMAQVCKFSQMEDDMKEILKME